MPAPFTRQSVTERALARVGTTLQQKYRIDRLLGIGGTAAVYAATHRNGHKVAIKFLLDHLLDDSDIYHLFSREAYVANRLGHPGAVPVLDDDEDTDGCVFLIMPLLEGETLRARWERANKRLPVAEVGVVLADVLDVLASAHTKGVVHRDIKPENLYVTTAAQVRVLDFGIARRTDADSTLTMTGRFIGTPAFMPPEQALGNRHAIGPHSDLWAAGATMFALLSGESVHVADTTGAQLAAAATRRAREIASVVPDLPPSVARVIDKALEFEAIDRWPTAHAMRDALMTALEEALGEKHDVTARRVRVDMVAEFASRAAERSAAETGTSGQHLRGEGEDGRSGVTRGGTGKKGTISGDDRTSPSPGPTSPLRVSSGEAERAGAEFGSDGEVTAAEGMAPPARTPRSPRRGLNGNLVGADRGPLVVEGSDGEARGAELVSALHEVPLPDAVALESRKASSGRRSSWLATVGSWIVIAALAGLTGAGAMRKCGDGGTGTTATASSTPATTNSDAQAALDAGLQLWRDAWSTAARKKFAEAAQRDPGLAAAHLFFAAASEKIDLDARTHLAEAQSLRGRLSPMQAALLDALEPAIAEPPNYSLTTTRLQALTTRFPDDAIAWTVRASHDIRTRESANVVSFVNHIPGAVGFLLRARAELHHGDVEDARKSLDSCVAAAPRAGIDCLVSRAKLEANEGHCENSALAAKRLIAIDHASPSGYAYLARAEFGRTRRTSAVRTILEQKWMRVPDAAQELQRERDEFFLAVLDGEFERAYAALDAWDKAAWKLGESSQHEDTFLHRIDLDLELGRTEAAQRATRAYAETSQTWIRNDYQDLPIETTRQLYRAGLISREEFLQRRATNEQGLIARGGLFATPGILWYAAYAETVVTAEDAQIAVSRRPEGVPILDAETREINADMEIGRTYLYAGKLDESLETLGRATKSCLYWKSIDRMHAHALYGDALAKSGRPRDACEEYSQVLQRWGRDPRSRSARRARESALHLHCPGITGTLPAK